MGLISKSTGLHHCSSVARSIVEYPRPVGCRRCSFGDKMDCSCLHGKNSTAVVDSAEQLPAFAAFDSAEQAFDTAERVPAFASFDRVDGYACGTALVSFSEYEHWMMSSWHEEYYSRHRGLDEHGRFFLSR